MYISFISFNKKILASFVKTSWLLITRAQLFEMNKNDNAAHHTYSDLFLLDLRILVSLCIKSNVRMFREGVHALMLGSFLNTYTVFSSWTCLLISQCFLHKTIMNSCLFFILFHRMHISYYPVLPTFPLSPRICNHSCCDLCPEYTCQANVNSEFISHRRCGTDSEVIWNFKMIILK